MVSDPECLKWHMNTHSVKDVRNFLQYVKCDFKKFRQRGGNIYIRPYRNVLII